MPRRSREVGHRPHRAEPGDEVGAGVEPQAVVGDLAHGQPPGGRRRDGDGEVGLALGQREQPRQRHHLHLEVGIVAAELVAGVDEQVVRRPRPAPRCGSSPTAGRRGRRSPPPPPGRRSPSPGRARRGRGPPRSARSPRASGRRASPRAPPRAPRSSGPPSSGRARASGPPSGAGCAARPRGRPAGHPISSCVSAWPAREPITKSPAFLQGGSGRFCAAAGRDRG